MPKISQLPRVTSADVNDNEFLILNTVDYTGQDVTRRISVDDLMTAVVREKIDGNFAPAGSGEGSGTVELPSNLVYYKENAQGLMLKDEDNNILKSLEKMTSYDENYGLYAGTVQNTIMSNGAIDIVNSWVLDGVPMPNDMVTYSSRTGLTAGTDTNDVLQQIVYADQNDELHIGSPTGQSIDVGNDSSAPAVYSRTDPWGDTTLYYKDSNNNEQTLISLWELNHLVCFPTDSWAPHFVGSFTNVANGVYIEGAIQTMTNGHLVTCENGVVTFGEGGLQVNVSDLVTANNTGETQQSIINDYSDMNELAEAIMDSSYFQEHISSGSSTPAVYTRTDSWSGTMLYYKDSNGDEQPLISLSDIEHLVCFPTDSWSPYFVGGFNERIADGAYVEAGLQSMANGHLVTYENSVIYFGWQGEQLNISDLVTCQDNMIKFGQSHYINLANLLVTANYSDINELAYAIMNSSCFQENISSYVNN